MQRQEQMHIGSLLQRIPELGFLEERLHKLLHRVKEMSSWYSDFLK